MGQLFFWAAVAFAGFGLAITAGRWAVRHASMLAFGLSLPPFLIGVTFVAIGTDIPEISNSVASSITGHGDLNVGDSIGSVVTQITLILGILPFAGGKFRIGPLRSLLVILLTVAALALGAWLVSDGGLSRLDAAALLLAWAVATAVSWRFAPPRAEAAALLTEPTHHKLYHAVALLAGLALVGAGATVAVRAIVEVSQWAGVPEYVISFFGSSLGTSMPELVVAVTALRSGQRDLAFGDVVGACLADSTLSIGIGPLIAPTAVTAALAVRGAFIAIVAVLVAGLLLGIRKRHDRWSGALLLLLYGAAYFVLF